MEKPEEAKLISNDRAHGPSSGQNQRDRLYQTSKRYAMRIMMPSHLILFKTDMEDVEASTVLEIFSRPETPFIKLHHTATSNIKRQMYLQ